MNNNFVLTSRNSSKYYKILVNDDDSLSDDMFELIDNNMPIVLSGEIYDISSKPYIKEEVKYGSYEESVSDFDLNELEEQVWFITYLLKNYPKEEKE